MVHQGSPLSQISTVTGSIVNRPADLQDRLLRVAGATHHQKSKAVRWAPYSPKIVNLERNGFWERKNIASA